MRAFLRHSTYPFSNRYLDFRDPTPVACTYSGLRFVSKQALEYAARRA